MVSVRQARAIFSCVYKNPLTCSLLVEFAGYAARASARNKLDRLMPYIIQNFFILVAPALFAASIYMTLSQVMRSVQGERYSLVSFRWLTTIFVGGDVVSFVVQGGAAPLMVLAQQKYMKIGEGVVIAGLFIQVVMFGFFIVTSCVFEKRMNRHLGSAVNAFGTCHWRQTMRMLYGVSALIVVRSVFRIVEYIMGYGGYLLRNEWPLYVFDAVLMSGVMGLFLWRFPSGHLSPLPSTSNDVQEISLFKPNSMRTKH